MTRNGYSFNKQGHQAHQFGHGNNASAGNNKSGGKKKKVTYCWNFNKGVACRFSPKCKFVERCSYCDSGAHGLHACPKLDNKKKQELLTNVHGGETVYPKEKSKYVK